MLTVTEKVLHGHDVIATEVSETPYGETFASIHLIWLGTDKQALLGSQQFRIDVQTNHQGSGQEVGAQHGLGVNGNARYQIGATNGH